MSPRRRVPCKANQNNESKAGKQVYDSIEQTTRRTSKPRTPRSKSNHSHMTTAGVSSRPRPGQVRYHEGLDGRTTHVRSEGFHSPIRKRVQYPLPDDSSRAGTTVRNERRSESRPATARADGPRDGMERAWSPSRKRVSKGRSLEATSSGMYAAMGQHPTATPYEQGQQCAPHHRQQARILSSEEVPTKITMFSRGKCAISAASQSKEGTLPVVDNKIRANRTDQHITNSRVLLEHSTNKSSTPTRRVRLGCKSQQDDSLKRSQSLNVLVSHSYGPGGNFKSPTKESQREAYTKAFAESVKSNNGNRVLYEKLRQRER